MSMKNIAHIRGRMRGVSIVEVLVALVIISVGMLGIAGLYLSSLQASRSANLRLQAVNLATDMADHIRANKRGMANYKATASDKGTSHDCTKAVCNPKDLAENDIYLWKLAISAALPANANGTLTYTDVAVVDPKRPPPDYCEILVTWREAGADVDSTYKTTVEQ
jgi:type IV pilus assembly protein PilV